MRNKFVFRIVVVAYLFIGMRIFAQTDGYQGNYYCTCADERFFSRLLSLIGSIHAVDFEDLAEIAVFDLGFTQAQINRLKSIQKVNVYQIEKVHPDILKHFRTSNQGRQVRGWFAWKPVAIKQALDMFPYILYLDAGLTVLRPTRDLFKHIQQNGYFFVNNMCNIEERVTKPVLEAIVYPLPLEQQKLILDKNTLEFDAGFQGVSRLMYENYVMPMYRLASHLELFADDGSAKLGFGAGRHDQVLFSIHAHLLNPKTKFNSYGWSNLTIDGRPHPINVQWEASKVTGETTILVSCDLKKIDYYEKRIRYK